MSTSERRPADRRDAGIGLIPILPIFVRLDGKNALVIGSGPAADWKAELLLAAGALLRIVAGEPSERLQRIVDSSDRAVLLRRSWREADFADAFLAVAEAADGEEAARLAAVAKESGTFLNVVDKPDFGAFQFGAIVERSPVVIGISTNGAAPVLAQEIRARIEALLPQGLRNWASAALAWRPDLRSKAPEPHLRRRFWRLFARRAMMASETAPDAADFDSLLGAALEAKKEGAGSVVLVGGGPGDPDLLTMKAVRALQSADVVLYDDLVSSQTVAMARREAQKITVGKRGYKPSCTQEDITSLVLKLARQGKRVVRLKGGDPSVFGRANEEIVRLEEAGVPVEIVPGVTSASAAAASLRRSLTERDIARRLQFVTAHAKDGKLPEDLDWRALADPRATTAVYMGLRTLPLLVERLLAEGLPPDTPAALVENASLPNERRLRAPIAALPQAALAAGVKGPCLTLIGRVIG